MTLEIRTAAELATGEVVARWARRRADRAGEVFRAVLRAFVDRPGPILLQAIVAALPTRSREAVLAELATLDDQDVIVVRGDRIEFAYPFAASPTAFALVLGTPAGGPQAPVGVAAPVDRVRYACCAIDALGVAPMLDQTIELKSRCHGTGAPLGFPVRPAGPGPEADGVMVWVAQRWPADGKVIDGL